ncbi:MAG: ATP-binding protein [Chlamydiae bacterium]|nr:ATP-binding protein [Chlamydiota bacterium]
MRRLYDEIIKQHFTENSVVLFLSGPRQVGKTTSSQQAAADISPSVIYLNWDIEDHRALILQGQSSVIQLAQLEKLSTEKPIFIFDEIHKYDQWKNFIKGFYDAYKERIFILVTGSARLDIYKKGGDSLMGRYFSYRMHPLSVGECLGFPSFSSDIQHPRPCDASLIRRLMEFGGFPMPYLKQDPRFSLRWQKLRHQQLFKEDIRDTSSIVDIQRLEILAKILSMQASKLTTYSSLANKVKVSVDTVSRWIQLLESFYFCYLIRPWSRNITRSLIKEPKVFLWDWSLIKDPGARAENFIASHLLKAVHYWSDLGLGEYDLFYLRDLEKREVDFIVTKNDEPWFLVEVKHSNNAGISKNLHYFLHATQAKHAFQVILDEPYVQKDCFTSSSPIIVPAATFLSQLI